MLVYYGTRLSENISRREPEGYLLCLNVPVARTGVQEYLPEELGIPPPGGNPSALIPVYRPEEEVFSPECAASFEGMPVTNDHPADGVTLDNIRFLQKGHVHNVRRGSGDESDLLLADLIITDPYLIDLILMEGKREISCGYTYRLCEENGRYVQRSIRGNHIAVVDSGRAGPRVRIIDSKPERRNITMKKSLSKILARMAKDGNFEEVAEFIDELLEPGQNSTETPDGTAPVPVLPVSVPAAPVTPSAEAPLAPVIPFPSAAQAEISVPEGREITVDCDQVSAILERLDRLISLLAGAAAAADEESAAGAADPIEEIVGKLAAAPDDDPEADPLAPPVDEVLASLAPASSILEPGPEDLTDCDDPYRPIDPDAAAAADALRAALRVVRPVLARMPASQRSRACADIAARVRASSRRRASGAYSALARAGARDRSVSGASLGQKIMASRNANMRK